MGKRSAGVYIASPSSIEIDFPYLGARCRERIKLAPTPQNLRWAANKRGQILVEIEKGTFDYALHFPSSARARKVTLKPGGLVTVAQALRAWMERKRRELEHSTVVGYERAVENVLIPAFGKLMLRELTRAHVRNWIGSKDVTAKRLNNALSPLRQLLAEAALDGDISEDPMRDVHVKRRRKVDERDDVDPFTPAELTAILDHATGQFRALVQFAVATGMRTSELIALRWDDVDLVGMTARVRAAFVYGRRKRPKTAAGDRVVPLLGPAVAALRAQQAHTRLKGGAVFENPATLEPWAGDKQIREWNWRPLLKRAGVRYRYPYQLRHTFASTMLSAGENVMWVARVMGHKDWGVTARKYARFMPSVDTGAGSKGAAAWSGFCQLDTANPRG